MQTPVRLIGTCPQVPELYLMVRPQQPEASSRPEILEGALAGLRITVTLSLDDHFRSTSKTKPQEHR